MTYTTKTEEMAELARRNHDNLQKANAESNRDRTNNIEAAMIRVEAKISQSQKSGLVKRLKKAHQRQD